MSDSMVKSSDFLREHWLELETKLRKSGYDYIAGVDEVGRGPLAGPVVAGVVILPAYCAIEGLNDSKKLTPARRQVLAEEILCKAIGWATATISSRVIDEVGILPATFQAMRAALGKLGIIPDCLLVDGKMKVPGYLGYQEPIVGGDGLAAPIAAASIIAKVVRDELMVRYAKIFPGYGFENHKGYGTLAHRQALSDLGLAPIHRKSFVHNIVA